MDLRIFTDGGALNNPGEAAIAYVIYLGKSLFFKHGERIGIATNNTAEYTALIKALEKAKEVILANPVEKILVTSDSELLVRQLNGVYKIKHSQIKEYVNRVKMLEQELQVPVSYTHTLREGNELADSLVKKALGR